MSVVVCVLLMLILVNFAMAGTPTTQKGSAALYFPFNGLSTLTYDNTYLGAQFFLMDKVAFAMGFGFKSERDKADKDDDPEIDKTTVMNGGIYYYPVQKGAVALYVAPEAGLELSSNYLKDVTDCTYRTLRGGLLFGAEWWVFDQISLSADIWFGLEYYWGTEKNLVLDTKDEPRNLKLGIIGNSADCVNISYYFK